MKHGYWDFFPFLQWGKLISPKSVKADFIAGLTGAIIVLPQGIAFAMIAGLPPVYGLYTAIVTPIVAALFGSSHHLISGPTTAISIAIFSTISDFAQPASENFIALTITITLMAGIIQFILGLARLGTLVNFVSHSVVIGFTAGAAVLIASNQLKYVTGLTIPSGASFLNTWASFIKQFLEINLHAVLIGTVSLGTAIGIKYFLPKWPNLLLAMITASLLALLAHGDIIYVSPIPSHLPPFEMPELNLSLVRQLAPGSFAIAILGLIEAVAIARGIASRTGQRIDGNQEFIGQGLSNIVGSFFSCYAGSGSFTRSGVNYTAGAQTPLSAIFAALLLMLILLLVTPYATYLPMAAMGGIILLVAYNLIDFTHIRQIIQTGKPETAVLAITFFSTLFLELEFAIYAGVFFSLVLYLMKTSRPHLVRLAPKPDAPNRKFSNAELYHLPECPQLHVVRIDGSLFFGAVDHVKNQLHALSETKKNILIAGSGINFIDLEGAEMFVQEAERVRSLGGHFCLSSLKKSVRAYMQKGYAQQVGEDNIFPHKEPAITSLYQRMDQQTCAQCTARVFRECQGKKQ